MTREEVSNTILQRIEIDREIEFEDDDHSTLCYSYGDMKYRVSVDKNNKQINYEDLQSWNSNTPLFSFEHGEIFLDLSDFTNISLFSFEEMCWKIKTGTWLRKRAAEDLRRREEIV